MKLKFNGFLVLLIVLVTQISFAQERVVSGIVSDNAGLPLPGVSVLVKGTQSGTQTDFDGKYSIKASSSQVLVFSFIGMKSQEVKATKSSISVKMASDSQQLSEVVVTAFGVKREKKSLGYSTQSVTGEDLNKSPSTNFVSNLSGKVAGLQIKTGTNFGGSVDVVLRGYRSITGNNQALFVVDGVPMINNNNNTSDQALSGRPGYDFGNTISDINPNDIADVNVLKGAAATALYGSRASNGAIIITTKRGKANTDLGIEFSSSYSTATYDKSTFAKYQNKYGEGYGFYYGPNGTQTDFYNPTTGAVNASENDQPLAPTYDDASYGAPLNPNLNVWQYGAFIPGSPTFGKATPYVAAQNGPGAFFQTGVTSNNSISFSKGNDVSSFRLSYQNQNSTDIEPNSNMSKNSFTGNASYKLSDKLTANFYGTYVDQNTIGRNSTGYNNNIMSNFRQWWAVTTDLKDQKNFYFNSGGKNYTWNINSPTDLTPSYWDNVYFQRYQNFETDRRTRFAGNFSLNYEINKHISLLFRAGTDGYNQIMDDRKAVGSVAGLMGFGLTTVDQPSGYAVMNIHAQESNYDFLATFKHELGENVSLNAILGGNINDQSRYTNSLSTSGGLFIPGIYTISNSSSTPSLPSITDTRKIVNGIFAQANVGLKETYFIDGTVRRDQSSALPTNNNSYVYYSGSASVVISNWSFLKDIPALSFGKLRASYAEVGSDTGANQLQNQYYAQTSVNSPLYAYNTVAKNANLRPERSKQTEAGINLQFLKNRFGLDLAWFKNDSFDQILNLPVSYATGSGSQTQNVGNLRTSGLEIALNLNLLKLDNFRWDMNVNWSNPITKVTELAPGVENITLGSYQGGVTINASRGDLYGAIKGTNYIYTNGQKTVGANGRYLITPGTNNVIGNIQAKWFGGLINKFTYKNISLSVQVDMKKGGQVFSLDQYYGQATGIYVESAGNNDLGNPVRNSLANGGGIIRPGVYADGTPNTTRVSGTNYGLYGYRYSPAAGFVYDAGFVKLREVALTYNLTSKILEKTFIKGMSLSVIGNNLWIIQKSLPYADPEAGLSSGNAQGYQSGVMPSTKNMSFSVKMNF